MFVEKKDRLLTWTACRVAECSNSREFFQGTLGEGEGLYRGFFCAFSTFCLCLLGRVL